MCGTVRGFVVSMLHTTTTAGCMSLDCVARQRYGKVPNEHDTAPTTDYSNTIQLCILVCTCIYMCVFVIQNQRETTTLTYVGCIRVGAPVFSNTSHGRFIRPIYRVQYTVFMIYYEVTARRHQHGYVWCMHTPCALCVCAINNHTCVQTQTECIDYVIGFQCEGGVIRRSCEHASQLLAFSVYNYV